MSDVYQLIYASESSQQEGLSSLNFEISRILIHSKRNNSKNNIHGVLYYANGYFVQALEGDKNAVIALFNKIKLDKRHFNVRVLRQIFVAKPQFQQWSMHLVADTQNLKHMLNEHGMKEFMPHGFSETLLNQFILFLSEDGHYHKPMRPVESSIKSGLLSGFKKRLITRRAA